MSDSLQKIVKEICAKVKNDRTRLIDIISEVQSKYHHVSSEAMGYIANELKIQKVEVKSVVSFYAFFSQEPKGEIIIRVCNDVVDMMLGADRIAQVLKDDLGIDFGETTADGKFSLEWTPCIGMCDQAPAILVNDVVCTSMSIEKAHKIVQELKKHGDPLRLVKDHGDGNNAHALVKAMVKNNILKKADVLLSERDDDSGLKKALSISPEEVIQEVKLSKLRGRGGAGFPTGMKWEFTRAAKGNRKFIICNADEGEPGTFKDRVLLTEKHNLLFEGMTVGGYAIGAQEGLIYLRAEYVYLRKFLEKKLEERREQRLLGKDICGKKGVHFDIRIQMGAGAYICGEESALISSCEGLRGDPKTRPPFPAQKGYLGCPTSVNNVETLCCAARILEKGWAWFTNAGSEESMGTKLLSVSGDCKRPGVYEIPFGISVRKLLKEVGGENAQAVLVGGPSGTFVAANEYHRTICYDDLATGGAVVVIGPERDLLDIVNQYMEFFIEESCGYCTPCRVGNVLLKERLDAIINGLGIPSDLLYLEELGNTIKKTSRCGLGQTSPNPIVSTIKNFRLAYKSKITKKDTGMRPTFDIHTALKESEELTGRKSEIFNK
ncbi:NAD-reducing [NiFe] hydrogenase HoxFUYH(E), subunit alpha (HoxF) [hydrothermal vent metagenome]|uniref:NAD-reducing [NiFe] hydrogenase HoxFUYH(E), subunit alpha (HoxF) n=1 Tax=hydrothermal vent metagenome TaxID=652676 RepID=A0A3B1DTS9_9ZZZZ